MGVGAYESHQYMQEIGGKINVESKLGAGTTITLYLPIFDLPHQSDLQDLQKKVAA
jgi:signal transduction histidine kinase